MGVKSILKLTLLSLIFCVALSHIPKFPTPSAESAGSPMLPNTQTLFFDQKVSHFNFKLAGKTYKQKYLLDNSYWNKDAKGPILMYCGN